MRNRSRWLILLLVALAALWGCSDDDYPLCPVQPEPGQTPFEVLATAGAAYLNDDGDCPGLVSAVDLHDDLDQYTVIDLRREADYLAGHIPGAYHSSLATLLDDMGTTIPTDKPLVVVCYSGQSAGHAKIALELAGYEDVKSLLFGMASWNSSLSGHWDDNVGNALANPETEGHNDELTTHHDFPTLAGYTTENVVQQRVRETLAAGFRGITYQQMVDNGLENYFIINYFGPADYAGEGSAGVPGHIPGAYQFTPYQSLGPDQLLDRLPTDKPIVVYCWTGQHSSQVVFYLNALGYEAYSLKFGANGLFHDALTAHKWTSAQTHDFPLEAGSRPDEAFVTLAAAGVAYLNDEGDCPGVLSAVDLHDNLEQYTVIDLRSQADYDAGHIPGAYHSSLATLLDDVGTTIPTDKPLVVVCYSGQSAGHAKIALELVGYEDVKSLLFGMASWNSSLSGHWDDNVGNALTDPETTGHNDELTGQVYPDLSGYDPATVVQQRVSETLAAGFRGITYQQMVDNGLENYFIINYFGPADYAGEGSAGVPGHIPGAYQFTPYGSLDVTQMLGYLPTDKPIVVYCWTGQHSSQVVFYLNALGYEAYSLKFGANGLFYDDLTAHKWSAAQTHEFPLESSETRLAVGF